MKAESRAVLKAAYWVGNLVDQKAVRKVESSVAWMVEPRAERTVAWMAEMTVDCSAE